MQKTRARVADDTDGQSQVSLPSSPTVALEIASTTFHLQARRQLHVHGITKPIPHSDELPACKNALAWLY